jgi:hypothetical protein
MTRIIGGSVRGTDDSDGHRVPGPVMPPLAVIMIIIRVGLGCSGTLAAASDGHRVAAAGPGHTVTVSGPSPGPIQSR